MDLKSVSDYILNEAAVWPFKDQLHGIDLSPYLKIAAAKYCSESNWYVPIKDHEFSQSVAYGVALAYKDGLQKLQKFITSMGDDVILAGLSRSGLQIQYVPDNQLTKEMVFKAVETDAHALRYIDKRWHDRELIDMAISRDASSLAYVEHAKLDSELVQKAVSNIPWVVTYVPESLVSPDLLISAVAADGLIIDEIPEHELTEKLLMAAVKNNPLALHACPEPMLSKKLVAYAGKNHPEIKGDGWYKQYVSKVSVTAPTSERL